WKFRLHGNSASWRPRRPFRIEQITRQIKPKHSQLACGQGRLMKDKIVTADEAIAIIRDRDVLCTSGFVGVGTPDELLLALEKRYRETRHPSDLTLLFAAAPGDSKDRGLNRLAHDGLVRRVVGGHWALVPRLGNLHLPTASRLTTCRSAAFRISIEALPPAA